MRAFTDDVGHGDRAAGVPNAPRDGHPMKRARATQGRRATARTVLLAALTVAALAVTVARASAEPTGALTTAQADGAWTTAQIEGSMTEDGQFAGYGPGYPAYLVDWRPVVTVAPSLPAYACTGDEVLDSDPNTRVVYTGATQTAPGSVPFDLASAAILSGVYGQRDCLSELTTVSAQQAVCIAQAPILGQNPHACPFENKIVTRSVAGKTLTPAPAPQPTPTPVPTATPTPTPTPTTPTPTVKPKLKLGRHEAVTQARKTLTRRYRRGRARHITAAATGNPARRRGRAAWTYRSRRETATVTVTKLARHRYRVKITKHHAVRVKP